MESRPKRRGALFAYRKRHSPSLARWMNQQLQVGRDQRDKTTWTTGSRCRARPTIWLCRFGRKIRSVGASETEVTGGVWERSAQSSENRDHEVVDPDEGGGSLSQSGSVSGGATSGEVGSGAGMFWAESGGASEVGGGNGLIGRVGDPVSMKCASSEEIGSATGVVPREGCGVQVPGARRRFKLHGLSVCC